MFSPSEKKRLDDPELDIMFHCLKKCGDLGGHMHHLAHSMTKLCQGREQDNAGWVGIPVNDSSGEKAVFIVVCRGGDLLVCKRVDDSSSLAIPGTIPLPMSFGCKLWVHKKCSGLQRLTPNPDYRGARCMGNARPIDGRPQNEVCLFVLLLYVPSQQLWSLRDGQFT